MNIEEYLKFERKWTIRKFANNLAVAQWQPFEVVEFGGNLLLNEGIALLEDLLIGAGGTAYNNASAFLAVGDGGPTALSGTSVTMTNASTAVTGVGTAFTTDLAVGDYIYLNSQKTHLGKVASITNNTALVLTANYTGATATTTASKILNEAASQTDLQAGANKFYKAMSATYPQRAAQTIAWRSAFGSAEANFDWMEFSVANGNSGASTNLNRKVSAQGAKVAGQTWTLDLTLTIS
jgi:hypothetical protein